MSGFGYGFLEVAGGEVYSGGDFMEQVLYCLTSNFSSGWAESPTQGGRLGKWPSSVVLERFINDVSNAARVLTLLSSPLLCLLTPVDF